MNGLYCSGTDIRDEYGRQRIFRGVNICLKLKKSDLYEARKQLLRKKVIKNLKKSGVNIVRLGITWASLEENRGEYSEELAEILHKFAKRCESENIWVMPDMHQDLFSHYFHGDGAPKWAVDSALENKAPLAIWAEGYFYMNGVQQAFYDFWQNKNNIQEDFINCWKFLADTFSDCKNIFGCDYFNEPFVHSGGREIFMHILNGVSKAAGSNIDFHYCFRGKREKTGMMMAALRLLCALKTPSAFKALLEKLDDKQEFSKVVDGKDHIVADFSKNYYQPFFDKMISSVSRGFNVFEHCYYSNLGIPFCIDVPENSVYSPHAYDIFIDSPLYNKYCSDERIDFILGRIRENQLKMNVPVVMGEWGGMQGGRKSVSHIDHIMGKFEEYKWSSIYWNMKFDDGILLSVFNRPYPAAVNGEIKEFHTDCESRKFTLSWYQPRPCAQYSKQSNIIYIPGRGMTHFAGVAGENRIEIDY